jgi:hypothetical protein
MRIASLGIGLAAIVSLALLGPAHAQSTKGAGKSSISIIKWDPTKPDPDGPGLHGTGGVANVNQKAAGTFSGKPKASVVGLPPTGGTITTLKLAKDIGDSLKPGFAAGRYVVEIETGASPEADALIKTFFTLTVDSLFKCTIDVSPTVATGSPDCGGLGQPLCDDAEIGKCTISTYQIAGAATNTINCAPQPTYKCGVIDGEPNASRARIRTLAPADEANCKTGYVKLGALTIVPNGGTVSCENGPVVGIVGVGSGDVDP